MRLYSMKQPSVDEITDVYVRTSTNSDKHKEKKNNFWDTSISVLARNLNGREENWLTAF